jgi:hypothetical protein
LRRQTWLYRRRDRKSISVLVNDPNARAHPNAMTRSVQFTVRKRARETFDQSYSIRVSPHLPQTPETQYPEEYAE